jgi:hypothetical protein
VLPLGMPLWGVLDAQSEVKPVDPRFTRFRLQRCGRLCPKAFSNGRIHIVRIGGTPPFRDDFFGLGETFSRRQAIGFLVLITGSQRRQMIPQVSARPGGPRETVVNVQQFFPQLLAGPHAQQAAAFSEVKSQLAVPITLSMPSGLPHAYRPL